MSTAPPPRSAVDPLLALFFVAWRGFAAEPDAVLSRHGLARWHHRILYAVARVPGVGVGELATALGITRQALHRPLGELEERGLVSRQVSPASARERALFLTRRGAELEEAASSTQRTQLRRAFQKLGRGAASGWVKVMRELARPVAAQSPGLLDRIAPAVPARRRGQR